MFSVLSYLNSFSAARLLPTVPAGHELASVVPVTSGSKLGAATLTLAAAYRYTPNQGNFRGRQRYLIKRLGQLGYEVQLAEKHAA